MADESKKIDMAELEARVSAAEKALVALGSHALMGGKSLVSEFVAWYEALKAKHFPPPKP